LPLHDLPERDAQHPRPRLLALPPPPASDRPGEDALRLPGLSPLAGEPGATGAPRAPSRRAGRHVARHRPRPGPLQPAARAGRHALGRVRGVTPERAGAPHPALPPDARELRRRVRRSTGIVAIVALTTVAACRADDPVCGTVKTVEELAIGSFHTCALLG